LTVQPCSSCHSTVVVTSVPGYTPGSCSGCVSGGIPPVLPPVASYTPIKQPNQGPAAAPEPRPTTAQLQGITSTVGRATGPSPSEGGPQGGGPPASPLPVGPAPTLTYGGGPPSPPHTGSVGPSGGTTLSESRTTTAHTPTLPSGPSRPYVTGAGSRSCFSSLAYVSGLLVCVFMAF